jgi:hypothetical protein
MKVFRVVVAVLVLLVLAFSDARAKETVCGPALERCLAQCDRYPALIREGCMLGCGIGYLNCN